MKFINPDDDPAIGRLARIGVRLTDALEADPEYQEGDKAVVIFRGFDAAGACITFGYENDGGAVKDLMSYTEMICRENGARMLVVMEVSEAN